MAPSSVTPDVPSLLPASVRFPALQSRPRQTFYPESSRSLAPWLEGAVGRDGERCGGTAPRWGQARCADPRVPAWLGRVARAPHLARRHSLAHMGFSGAKCPQPPRHTVLSHPGFSHTKGPGGMLVPFSPVQKLHVKHPPWAWALGKQGSFSQDVTVQ